MATELSPNTAKGSLFTKARPRSCSSLARLSIKKTSANRLVLLLPDQKLPAEEWKSSLDIMMHQSKWNGIVFFLDKEGNVFRTDVHMKGEQTGVSGIFELKIDNPAK